MRRVQIYQSVWLMEGLNGGTQGGLGLGLENVGRLRTMEDQKIKFQPGAWGQEGMS